MMFFVLLSPDNEIGVEGACALKDALSHPNCKLTELGMDGEYVDMRWM